MIKNKRAIATSISAWTELSLILIVVITTFSIIIVTMDNEYSVPVSSTPLIWSNNTMQYLNTFVNQTQISKIGIEEGEVQFGSLFGFNWVSAWGIVKAISLIIWDIVWGNWIPQILINVFYGFPHIILIAYALQVLFVMGLVFAIVTIVTKVKRP